MRIIAGKFRGIKLFEPQSLETRPTMDRVKQSMFDVLYGKIENATCLDLFAGSGSLGIEALSRGAKSCCFVDLSENACKIIKDNLKKIKIDADVLSLAFESALKRFNHDLYKFDLVLLDPPYASDFGEKSIEQILKLDLLSNDGIIVFETSKNVDEFLNKNKLKFKLQKYGQKFVYFCTK